MITYAIVGTGRMATHHAGKLRQLADARLLAVCGTSMEKARAFTDKFGGMPFTDLETMLDQTKPDAVYLTTPARGRVEQVRAIAAQDIHLYMEKPIASSVEEAMEIIELIKQGGIISTVGFHWRSMDIVKKAAEFIREKPVSMAVGRFYWTIPLVEWIRERHLGGGQMFDQTTHMIDLSIHFLADVDHLFASYTQVATKGEMNNWDAYSITAAFKNGCVGNFYSTYALFPNSGEEPFLDVIQKNRLIRITNERLIVKTPSHEEVFKSQDRGMGATIDFHKAVLNQAPEVCPCPLEDAMRTHKFTLAASSSALSGKVVKLDDFNHFGLDNLK
ncbi:Gfo/Idh/MocA family protein [Paenibacillus sp. tmac-D7]|uniref:Gfo/Idh/MocA family protein n=1 Tax=Paenibacillus sp. tmac-D7 TaxID=2591462 RepID=UPI0011424F2D|nr:Gfo/Idh/MocA family oxidoreductase [Paenibacillus sp. tmac-D7]